MWMVLLIGAVTFGVSDTRLHSSNENVQLDMNEFLCLIPISHVKKKGKYPISS